MLFTLFSANDAHILRRNAAMIRRKGHHERCIPFRYGGFFRHDGQDPALQYRRTGVQAAPGERAFDGELYLPCINDRLQPFCCAKAGLLIEMILANQPLQRRDISPCRLIPLLTEAFHRADGRRCCLYHRNADRRCRLIVAAGMTAQNQRYDQQRCQECVSVPCQQIAQPAQRAPSRS